MIAAGRLSERIAIEQKSVTRAANGEEVVTWTTYATTWAEVTPLRGREFFAAAQMQDSIDYRIRIRYRSGVVPQMRIMWRGTPLDIVSVIDVGAMREELEIMCASGVRNAR